MGATEEHPAGGYLVKPLGRLTLYEFRPEALYRGYGTDRFGEKRYNVHKLLSNGSGNLTTRARSPDQAASQIAMKHGADRFTVGGYTDDILMFGVDREGSNAYCPGFMAEVRNGILPEGGGIRSWLSRFYDARDLGTTRYGRQPQGTRKGLARWFCRTHKFEWSLGRGCVKPEELGDVRMALEMTGSNGNGAPKRAELRQALRSILMHPGIYTDSQIRAVLGAAERNNLELGAEDAQERYAQGVIAGLGGYELGGTWQDETLAPEPALVTNHFGQNDFGRFGGLQPCRPGNGLGPERRARGRPGRAGDIPGQGWLF